MSDFESDLPSDNSGDWEERGDLAWNEFDWERYLRTQDEVLLRYLVAYEKHRDQPDRLDEVASAMGWDPARWEDEADSEDGDDSTDLDDDLEPYTLHKNPVFIATKALCLSLRRNWELISPDPAKVPQRTAVHYLLALHRAEDHAMLGVQALDLGDYAMAISLFKRALGEINNLLSLLHTDGAQTPRAVLLYREDALIRLFDLREIWLRVINECRDELQSPLGELDDDEDDED